MLNGDNPLSITKQCHTLGLSRSRVYYMPAPASDKDRELMRFIDEIHLEDPCLGSRGIKSILKMKGHEAGRIHVKTLMRKMGIEAIYKKPRLSTPHPDMWSIPTCCVVSILPVSTLSGVPILVRHELRELSASFTALTGV